MRLGTNFLLDNKRLRVVLAKPTQTQKLTVPAQHIAHIEKKYGAQSGDIIQDAQWKQRYLLVSFSTDRHRDVFHAMSCEAEREWTTITKSTHPVTGMVQGSAEVSQGNLWLAEDVQSPIADPGGNASKVVYYTGADVLEGDKIGGKLVRTVTAFRGVKRIEVY